MRLFLGMSLALAALVPLGFGYALADSFDVTFDRDGYSTGDTMVISGAVADFGMPVIAMSIFDPAGKILSANSVEISPDGSFSREVSLDSPFYDVIGEYVVLLEYGKVAEEYSFAVGTDTAPGEKSDTPSKEKTSKITSLYTERNLYHDGDTVRISGTVSSLDSPTVTVGVSDPFGNPAGFYFAVIGDDLEFSESFLAKDGVNFKAEGTYSVSAHYAGASMTHPFEYSAVPPVPVPAKVPPGEIPAETTPEAPATETAVPYKDTRPETVTEDGDAGHDNLSVEDIELGMLLNQMNLECDSSAFVDTISYYDGMGPALYRLCQFERSLDSFAESLASDPDNVEILANTGSALGKTGSVSEAIAYYDRAIALDTDYLPAKNNKANALAGLGDIDGAIALYREILDENPDYSTARANLDTALQKSPKVSAAPAAIPYPEPEPLPAPEPEPLPADPVSEEAAARPGFFENLSRAISSLFGW